MLCNVFSLILKPNTAQETTELWTVLADVWQAMPVEYFHKLNRSVPPRVEVSIKAKGGSTHY